MLLRFTFLLLKLRLDLPHQLQEFRRLLRVLVEEVQLGARSLRVLLDLLPQALIHEQLVPLTRP